jgi:hypothetical protein
MRKDNKTALIALAVAVLLLLLGVGGAYLVSNRSTTRDATASIGTSGGTAAPVARPSSQPLPPAGDKIRVGVILSVFNATGPSWVGKPAGYTRQVSFLRELKDPAIQPVALIDPGTANDPDIARIVQNSFSGRAAIEVTDAAKMDSVAVIVGPDIWNASPELLTAVARRVKNGGGLLFRQGFGCVTPGFTPEVAELCGLSEGQYGWNLESSICEVVTAHPLLGKLKPGDTLEMFPNGAYGVLARGTGLITLKDQQRINISGENFQQARADFVHNPLYVAELGKGKIVGCSFARFRPVPDELNAAAKDKFTVRCVKWLAGKPMD